MKIVYAPLHFLFLLLVGHHCLANDAIPVGKVSPNFVFDGKIGMGEWDHLQPIELTVQTPTYRAAPTEKTVIKLGYDESYIYLVGALYDQEPHKIRDNNKLRDGEDLSTEQFGILIDSYNDKQNALLFFTTPSGARWDATVLKDASSRQPLNTSWNNFWDVKTQVTSEGWFVEMRIPFTSLQYQVVDGKVTMGISTWRYIARKNEIHISPDIAPDQGEFGRYRPSLAKEYTFEGIKKKKPFYITPYVLGGATNSNELNDPETEYVADNKLVSDVGLDVKYGISNNFTLDLSVNTDFAQVEADNQQVNLSRFSLFFPEKRLFFQERSGIFDFSLGSRSNLFYSRRIGIDEDGQAIPILGGARLTGRAGDWDIGLISMQTQKTDDFASNNYSVFRVKKRILNENSDAGILFTNNFDTEGNTNSVYGFDTSIRFFKDNFVSFKLAQSVTNDIESNLLSLDPTVFWLSLTRRSQKGFTYGTSFSRVGTDFQSNLGFLGRDDYLRFGLRTQYNWFPGKGSKLLRHGPSLSGVSYWENFDNSYNQAFYGLSYNWYWRNGALLQLGSRIQYDNILSELTLADIVTIPMDEYFYTALNIEFSTPTSLPYLLEGELTSGKFYDGSRTTLSLAPVYNMSSSLRLSAEYEFNKVDFDVRDQKFDIHIARLKALVMFSTKLSIASFIQYNSLDNLYLGNIRLRYNPKEGNDLYIVFNSDLNAERSIYDPLLPLSNQSSLLVKYSYTFSL